MSESKKFILEARMIEAPAAPPWRRCCATCEMLSDDGYCEAFEEHPPIEFIRVENKCEKYFELIPF